MAVPRKILRDQPLYEFNDQDYFFFLAAFFLATVFFLAAFFLAGTEFHLRSI